MPRILGVLNLSPDSFSEGGRHPDAPDAITHGRGLAAAGAWAVDVGAVSSNPDGRGLDPVTELARLEPVVAGLQAAGLRVSVDTFAPAVQRALAPRVEMLNDIRGFPDPSVHEALVHARCDLVVMHSVQQGPADRRSTDAATMPDRVLAFFEARMRALTAAGIAEERLILDPGMGFFLGADPAPSLAVLRALPWLAERTGRPLLVGLSRKSFLGALLGGRAPMDRGAATLAAELFAAAQGVAWIRTHDVAALADALTIRAALDDLAAVH